MHAVWRRDKVREGETGNPSRSQPGLPGTGRESGLGHALERRVSVLHRVFLPVWAQRSRGTFLPDSPQGHPCRLGRDIHVAHGPKVRYLTPSATCVITVQWFLKDVIPPQLQPYTVHIYQKPQYLNFPQSRGGCGPCFRTVRDRKSSSRPHGWVHGMS